MTWQKTAQQFNEQASQYDNWYRNSPVFDLELAALKAIQNLLPRPALEIGVGPGHFAQALQTEFGIDPAISPLHLAARRSIIAINGAGEYLPIQSGSIGTVYVLFTLCFLDNPAAVIRECFRILTHDGRLVTGFVPQGSAWGERIARLGSENPLPGSREDAGFNVLVTGKKGEYL